LLDKDAIFERMRNFDICQPKIFILSAYKIVAFFIKIAQLF